MAARSARKALHVRQFSLTAAGQKANCLAVAEEQARTGKGQGAHKL